jgi:hypothetical protein
MFPLWADILGWAIGASTILPFPIVALYRIFRAKSVSLQYILMTCMILMYQFKFRREVY